MNQRQTQEYLRIVFKKKDLIDNIKRKRNEQWRLRNEILQIGQQIGKTERKVNDLEKQQYRVLGRTFVEDEEEKDKKSS